MSINTGQFWATVCLYALPALIAAAKYGFESKRQRVVTGLLASVCTFVMSLAWTLDTLENAEKNTWMGSALVLLPIMVLVVIFGESSTRPPMQPRDNPQLTKRLISVAWSSMAVFVLVMVGSMETVHSRLT